MVSKLRVKYKMRIFENGVVRRILRPKRDGVTGGWRKLHNEEQRDLYFLSSIIKTIQVDDQIGGPCSMNGREESM
jgi:hypothetical protein